MKKYIIMVIFYGLLAIGKDFQKIEIDLYGGIEKRQ